MSQSVKLQGVGAWWGYIINQSITYTRPNLCQILFFLFSLFLLKAKHFFTKDMNVTMLYVLLFIKC